MECYLVSEKSHAYYLKNKEKILAMNRSWKQANRDRNLSRQRTWYAENKVAIRARHKARLDADPEKKRAYSKAQAKRVLAYYHKNKEKLMPKMVAYIRRKRATDPLFKLRHSLCSRLYSALRRGSTSSTNRAKTGCSASHLRCHLQSQFQPGMSWENYGTAWQVDHYFPLNAFNLSNEKELAFVCNWKNLRPLWAAENASKSDRITPGQAMLLFVARQFSLV